MFRKVVGSLVERPWLRIGLAAALLFVGLAPVGAPILSDNAVRQSFGVSPEVTAAPVYNYRYANLPNGSAQIQRSPAGSQAWSVLATLPESVDQLGISPAGQSVLYARSVDNIWRSQDGGTNWTKTQALPSKPLSMAVAKEISGLVLAGTATSGLYISSDRGDSWHSAGGSLSLAGPGTLAVPAVALNPTDENIVYATAQITMATPEGSHSTSEVFVSPDGGRRWFQMQPSGNAGTAVPPGQGTHILPAAGQPLAATVAGPGGTQNYTVANAPGLVSGLNDPDPVTRGATAQVLGLAHDASLAPALVKHIKDTDLAAGDRVAEAIGKLGNTSVTSDLVPLLGDRDEAVRGRAAYALGLLKYQPAIGRLTQMLQNDGPLARQRAAEGLAAIGTPAALAALMGPLSDANLTSSRQAAMQALETTGRPAVPQLISAMSSNDATVRRNAAETLGWIHSDDAAPVLSQALADADPQVREQAAWALGEIGTVPAQQALAQAVTAGADQPTRQAARTALAQAQQTHSVRAAVVESPLSAFLHALTQVPAGRWTLLFLVIALAAILLTLRPGQMQGGRQRA